jgi:hypothetical protein
MNEINDTSTTVATEAPAPKPATFSDTDLYHLCQEYGTNARVWKRRFAGLLPEVMRRQLYKRKGFGSIYEFAFKLGSLSEAAVDKVLSLAVRLEDKPCLKHQLETGEQGWSKLEKVSYVAEPETDKEWAEKVEKMSSMALQTYIQEKNKVAFTEIPKGLPFTPGSEAGNTLNLLQWGSMTFPVAPETEKRLRALKYQLEKEKHLTLTFNEVLQFLFQHKAPQEPQMVIQVCPACAARKAAQATSRPIPAATRRLIYAQTQGCCIFPGCKKPATSLHHTKRYRLSPGHDPKNIVPVCPAHERLLHSGMIENEEEEPRTWRLRKTAPSDAKALIDQKVKAYRSEKIPAHDEHLPRSVSEVPPVPQSDAPP